MSGMSQKDHPFELTKQLLLHLLQELLNLSKYAKAKYPEEEQLTQSRQAAAAEPAGSAVDSLNIQPNTDQKANKDDSL